MTSPILDFLALVAAYVLSLFTHELGHTLAALVAGWKPLTLEVGTGNQWTALRIGDFRVRFGSILNLGIVHAYTLDFRYFRIRQLLYVLGGPAANAALLGTTLLLHDKEIKEGRWALFLLAIFFLQGWFLLMSLIPRTAKTSRGELPSDGLLLWQTLWAKPEKLKEYFLGARILRVNFLLEEKRASEALPLIAEMRDELIKKTPSEAHAPDRVSMLDVLACIPVFHAIPELLPLGHEAIDEAIRLNPEAITLRGTKGSLLIESGDIPSGVAMLEQVRANSQCRNDQAISAYYLAYATAKQGDQATAQQQLKAAVVQYPDCLVRKKITEAMRG